MRNAILQLPDARTANERRQVLRAAIRQLERAETYLAAVAYMELNGRSAQRSVTRLRADVQALTCHLAVERTGIRD